MTVWFIRLHLRSRVRTRTSWRDVITFTLRTTKPSQALCSPQAQRTVRSAHCCANLRDVSLALLSTGPLNRASLASLDAVRVPDFDSAYYFDGGTFRYPVAGETHVNGTGQPSGGMDVKVSVVSEFR